MKEVEKWRDLDIMIALPWAEGHFDNTPEQHQ
jgi:hypothetical protein